MEEKLSFEKLSKLEVERELPESRANLAEATKAKEALQQESNKDKSYMYETANVLRDREGNARQKDEVFDELNSEWNTLRENCVQREQKQFTMLENLERSERLNREKDGEIVSFIIEVPTDKISVNKVTTLGAVAVGVDTVISKNDIVKGELGVDQVDDVNFMEIGGYVAKESVKEVSDVAKGVNLSQEQSRGVT